MQITGYITLNKALHGFLTTGIRPYAIGRLEYEPGPNLFRESFCEQGS